MKEEKDIKKTTKASRLKIQGGLGQEEILRVEIDLKDKNKDITGINDQVNYNFQFLKH